ncbi:MAG TPA: YbaB/EbfC family nucleoid-associated protein [Planctomycetes bacterium]|nr:YbaB/EbfC family nucleoid-associated protein [Planctomycetota bacterium]
MSGLGDMGNLLKQAQEMQRQVDRVRRELNSTSVEGQSGGGAVRVEIATDRTEVRAVRISPEAASSGDHAMLEDLVVGALQDALRRAAEAEREAIGRVTGGMHLPGLF